MERKMERKMLGNNLVNENLVMVPVAPPRFTMDDYAHDARQKNRVSEDQQMLADRILKESERLTDETQNVTEKCKKECDYRLKERMVDIQFLLDEVKKQKREASLEEEALKVYRQRTLSAIKYLKEMGVTICQKCIIIRENRLHIDMMEDEVDQELKREIIVIVSCQEMLEKTLAETNEQIRRLRATIYLLDRDLSNKSKSYQIDETNLSLRHNQLEMHIYEGSAPLNPFNTTNQEWIDYTNNSIQNTAKELNSAKPLRSYVDIILKQIVDDISNQVGRTNEAFTKRISETRYAKTVLEGIHNQTAKKINEITWNITKLEKELADKEGYVTLCQMRLANRTQRPGVELCDDVVQKCLMEELKQLRMTVGQLSQMLAESKATQRYLLHTQMTQEQEINIKANSLKIDEVDCMTIRQGLTITTF